MPERSYEGDALDGTVQYITERPEFEKEAEAVEYATDPERVGGATTENVPKPGEGAGCQFPGCTAPTDCTYCGDCRATTQGNGN